MARDATSYLTPEEEAAQRLGLFVPQASPEQVRAPFAIREVSPQQTTFAPSTASLPSTSEESVPTPGKPPIADARPRYSSSFEEHKASLPEEAMRRLGMPMRSPTDAVEAAYERALERAQEHYRSNRPNMFQSMMLSLGGQDPEQRRRAAAGPYEQLLANPPNYERLAQLGQGNPAEDEYRRALTREAHSRAALNEQYRGQNIQSQTRLREAQAAGREAQTDVYQRQHDPDAAAADGLRQVISNMPPDAVAAMGLQGDLTMFSYRELHERLASLGPTALSLLRRRARGGSGAGGGRRDASIAATQALITSITSQGQPLELAQALASLAAENGDRQLAQTLSGWMARGVSGEREENRQFLSGVERYMKDAEVMGETERGLALFDQAYRRLRTDPRRMMLAIQASLIQVSKSGEPIPTGAFPADVQAFSSAIESLTAPLRHKLFGVAFTDTERASFERMTTGGATANPEVALQNVLSMAQKARELLQQHRAARQAVMNQMADPRGRQVRGAQGVLGRAHDVQEATGPNTISDEEIF